MTIAATSSGLVFYRLRIRPGEHDADGECFDEWFSSIEAARRRRLECIRDARANRSLIKYGSDFEIERVALAPMSPKRMVLAVLNQREFIKTVRQVVAPWNARSDLE